MFFVNDVHYLMLVQCKLKNLLFYLLKLFDIQYFGCFYFLLLKFQHLCCCIFFIKNQWKFTKPLIFIFLIGYNSQYYHAIFIIITFLLIILLILHSHLIFLFTDELSYFFKQFFRRFFKKFKFVSLNDIWFSISFGI